MLLRVTLGVGFVFMLGLAAWAQAPAANQKESACTFQDGGQVSVRYTPVAAHGDHPPGGKAWSPGSGPVLLFTSTKLEAGDSTIPPGAYSLYVLVNKNDWMLVVNKDVSNTKYDDQQNLARLSMDQGMVGEPEKEVTLAFGHVAPKQCNLRVYYAKTGAWATFREP